MDTEQTEQKPPLQISPRNNFSSFKAYIIVALLFLSPLVVILLAYPQEGKWDKDKDNLSSAIEKQFPEIDLLAKSAYIWDMARQKPVYAKNERTQLPLASLAKIMTALVAADEVGNSEQIKITSDAIGQEGDNGLVNQEKWHLKDLIDFSLVTSSNDGAYALASAVESRYSSSSPRSKIDIGSRSMENKLEHKKFLDLMNKKSKEIGLDQTFFLNETGLDISDSEAGGYGSAEDLAKLFSYIIEKKPEIFEATAYSEVKLESLGEIIHVAENTNEIVGKIPNLIASKTGYTDLSGGNLVIAFDAGLMKPIVISILGSTREGRFEDMEKLVKATLVYLAEADRQD